MQNNHPPTEQLERLFQRQSPGHETEAVVAEMELEKHLQSCPTCQTRLEQVTADIEWWQKTATYLNDDGLDGEQADPAFFTNSGQSSDVVQELTDRSILDSPVHPEMLGRIGHHDIEQAIGSGGMGVVYKGYDTQLNRVVAIKVLSPHLASNGTARKRFAREARAAAAVVHPNVIPIHGVNSDGKLPYIVMQLVAGRSLQAHVDQDGPMETKEIVRVAMQIAAGLDAAHKQGLVHRDIKPANILMEDDLSRVMITDFGLARAADDAAMTQTGWLAGTPYYMSPEQSRGKSVDATSDLFSLGSVMFFMATGRVPFRAESPMAVLNLICNEPVTPVRQLNADIPRSLSDIIEKLLEKRPSDRFRSAMQLYQVLEDYLAYLQHPRTARPPKKLLTRVQLRRRSIALVFAAGWMAMLTTLYFALSHFWLGQNDFKHSDSVNQDQRTDLPSLIPADSPLRSLMPDAVFHEQIRELERELSQFEINLGKEPGQDDAHLSAPAGGNEHQ